MAKYYLDEHEAGYRRIRAEGKTTWDQLHEPASFDDFSMRPTLEWALPRLNLSVSQPRTLEYGCGTGPGACFMAARGFRVDGIDISPVAIDMAKELAAQRRLDVHYAVADICELPPSNIVYDLIVDSFCLQCIVTDSDRAEVFAAVRSRLKLNGYYLIGTAIFREGREYGDQMFDEETGVVYTQLEPNDATFEDAVERSGGLYLPNRRHLKPHVLIRELEEAGFKILQHREEGGGMGVICQRTDSSVMQRVVTPDRL